MDYGTALTTIETSDLPDKSALIDAIKANVKLTLDEKRATTARNAELETLVAAIVEGTGAAGESLADKVKDAAAKVAALTKTVGDKDTELAKLVTEKATLEGTLGALKRKATIGEIAAKIGASAAVLDRLVTDAATIEVDGEAVKIGGVVMADWLESTDIKPFTPALFPDKSLTKSESRLPKLPSGPASADDRPTSVYEQIRRNNWKPKGA